MYSMSTKREEEIIKSVQQQNNMAMKDYDTVSEYRKRTGSGSINPKGLFEPDEHFLRWGLNARGVRDRFYNVSYNILREMSRRVAVISAIHNLRCSQIRPFARRAYNEDEIGFLVKIKDKKRSPNKKEQLKCEEIEEFLLHAGFTNFEGAEDREEWMEESNELIVRELLTIDQVAISIQRDRSGKPIAFWVLDGATIKKTIPGRGYMGDKEIKYVQEVEAKIIETFTDDDIVFYFSNRRADIRRRGYGYSLLEMSMDVVTSWLFGMQYNKEFFNSSSQPKGMITFEGEKLNQADLEELQREWISMFRGIKGLWKTPFLQHNAKWQSISPSNRDMEFNEYIQMLGSWVCAIHGVDSQELGVKLNQTQNVMNENNESKLAYSKDRGLKTLLASLENIYNKIIWKNPEWRDFQVSFSGTETKDKKGEVEIDEKQVSVYMTLNEKRKEKDLEPIENGDIILNPQFIQYLQSKEAAQQQESMGGMEGGDMEQGGGEESPDGGDAGGEEGEPEFEIDESDLKMEKSKNGDDFFEIII